MGEGKEGNLISFRLTTFVDKLQGDKIACL